MQCMEYFTLSLRKFCFAALSLTFRVVQRLVSANLGLNFNPGLFFFSSKPSSLKIFSILSILNLALDNPALVCSNCLSNFE